MAPLVKYSFATFPALLLMLSLATALQAAPTVTGPSPEPIEIDHIVAVVDDGVILESELDDMLHTIRTQLRDQDTQLPPEAVLRKQVLERLILMRLQLQLAERTGVRVDDETLNAAMGNIAKQNHLSLSEFRSVLERDGFDFADFRENIRKQIIIGRLQQRQVNNLVTVTDQEVENFLATQKGAGQSSDYHLAHILIALPEGATPAQIQTARSRAEQVLERLRGGANFQETAVAVSDDRQALEGGDLGWRTAAQIPSLFTDVVPKMQPGQVSDLIRSPSGFHIIKLLEARGSDQHVVTQTQVRHILLRTNDLHSERDVRLRLEQLKQRVEGGEDFADLARSHSDDNGSAARGGSLGWVSPGDLAPEFEEAMNKLKIGEVSEPIRTPFGWHLIQVQQRRQHDDTDDFRRAKARELIRKRKTEEELDVWLRKLRDEAYVEYRTES